MLSTECLGPGLELNYLSKLLVPSNGRNDNLRHRVYDILGGYQNNNLGCFQKYWDAPKSLAGTRPRGQGLPYA